jgi:hypothetical protein
MSLVIHSGTMEKIHHLPYHVTDTGLTIVFEQDIINLVCQDNARIYAEHFLSSPNYFLHESMVEGSKAFPLLSFVNECINIFDYQVQAEVEGTREMSESLTYISQRVYPIVIAVAKIGAKVQFDGMEPGETPSIIFEREIRNSHQ